VLYQRYRRRSGVHVSDSCDTHLLLDYFSMVSRAHVPSKSRNPVPPVKLIFPPFRNPPPIIAHVLLDIDPKCPKNTTVTVISPCFLQPCWGSCVSYYMACFGESLENATEPCEDFSAAPGDVNCYGTTDVA